MKKLIFLCLIIILIFNQFTSVKSIFTSEISEIKTEIPSQPITKDHEYYFLLRRNQTYEYDIDLATVLVNNKIKYNPRDLTDFKNVKEIPLLIKYESPVVYGKTIGGYNIEGKKIVDDIQDRARQEQEDKMHSIKDEWEKEKKKKFEF